MSPVYRQFGTEITVAFQSGPRRVEIEIVRNYYAGDFKDVGVSDPDCLVLVDTQGGERRFPTLMAVVDDVTEHATYPVPHLRPDTNSRDLLNLFR